MKKLRKEDLDPAVFELYDAYAHQKLERRQFIERLSLYAIGGITLSSLLSFLMPDYQNAMLISPTDSQLISEVISYSSPKGGRIISGLFSKPGEAIEKLPGIVVVHENRGLNPYIEDVGRRAAMEGFVSLAPDALTPLGGYPGNDDEGRTMQAKRDKNEMLEDFIAAFEYLRTHSDCNGKVGVVGFCFGGWIANMMAVKLPGLGAAVPFYGSAPEEQDLSTVEAPLQLHFAEFDDRVNASWPAYKQALEEQGKDYEVFNYPGVHHGFHNNSTPRYDADAAGLAWERTVTFFREKLTV